MNETIQMHRTIMEETEAREGYKKTKLGWIPEEWGIARFNKIAVFNPKSESLPDSFIYIDLESVKDGVLRNKNMINKTNAPSRAQRLLEKNDVLFQTVRPYQKNNLYFEEEKENYVASSGYAQIRSKRDSQFIFHLIQATYFNNQVLARCTGTSFPAISSKDLSKVLIKLPTLPERQKIATILSTWDCAIAKQQQLIAAKQEYKKGLMQLLLTGKLRFEGFEGEWERKRFTDFSELIHGFQFRKDHFVETGYPVIKIGSLVDAKGLTFNNATYISKDIANKFENFRLFKGDVLMALTGGTLGKVAIIEDDYGKVYQNYRVGKFIPKKNCTKNYLGQLLQSFYVQQRVKSLVNEAAQPNIGKQDFDKIWIPLPSIDEQKVIASFLIKLDGEIEIQQKLITQFQEQKRGLMQRLLTGEVRVKIN